MYILFAVSCALQIGGAVTPHDGQCHLRNTTKGNETFYEYDNLRLVREHFQFHGKTHKSPYSARQILPTCNFKLSIHTHTVCCSLGVL